MSENGNLERGPKGDHGQAGDTGETGRQGEPGLVSQGERGPTGDHGQRGEAGLTGRAGTAGKAGPDPTRKLLFLFVFLAIIATTYGVVLQQAIEGVNSITERIDRDRAVDTYEECVSSGGFIGQYNTLLDALIKVDEDGIMLEPEDEKLTAVRLTRIAAYQAGKIELPDCEEIKP